MSNLKINNITDLAGTGAPNFANGLKLGTAGVLGPVTGDAPMFACRAWVNFNGTGTVAIRAAGNVSSITDNGTGDYTVNFTTPMLDGNYSFSIGSGTTAANAQEAVATSMTTTAIRIKTPNNVGSGFSVYDPDTVSVAIFR